MLKLHSSAVALMDRYGKAKVPFLFIISYDGSMAHIWRRDEVPEWVEFSMNNFSNRPEGDCCCGEFSFDKEPEPYESYLRRFNMVMRHIQRGDSYLLNLTRPTRITTSLTMAEIYRFSRAQHKIKFGNSFVCFSPESFVKLREDEIKTFPMKGTIDAEIPDAEGLILSDIKETSEHNTIVDLLRNDLGMVADKIKVDKYRYTERIESNSGPLLQVSSEISGTIRSGYRGMIGTIFSLILPAGSVTGAPKEKTVEIIRKAENYNRGFYTGIFGWFDGDSLDSAVMIRFIERTDNGLIFKSGGGITSLSNPVEEYNEMIKKVYVPIPGINKN